MIFLTTASMVSCLMRFVVYNAWGNLSCHTTYWKVISLQLYIIATSLNIYLFQRNKLNGSIPKGLGMLPMLHYLGLGRNRLMGAIPWSLSNISSLELLNLESNHLTGLFPHVMFNISSLMDIIVPSNYFSGTLPMELCTHCPNLQELSLSENKLGGQLPSQIHY